MRVLLIEPDRVLARSYVSALCQDKHEIAHASTAQSAVQAIDAQTPDVIIVNVDMPRHNGIEFLYEIRSYPEWQGIPVLLLVSRINQDLAESAILHEQLGVSDILMVSHTSLADLRRAVLSIGRPVA